MQKAKGKSISSQDITYREWLKEIKRLGIHTTFIPLRLGRFNPLAVDDRGEWLKPTREEINTGVSDGR